MSHNTSKTKWEALSDKEKELLWLRINGSRIVPAHLSGADLDKLFKQDMIHDTHRNNLSIGGQETSGGQLPD